MITYYSLCRIITHSKHSFLIHFLKGLILAVEIILSQVSKLELQNTCKNKARAGAGEGSVAKTLRCSLEDLALITSTLTTAHDHR